MNLNSLALFAAALFVAAVAPGPGVLALVARVTTEGLRPVLPFLLALWVGELIWLVAAVSGLSALALAFHDIFVVLKWLGVAYLCFLAWRMWTCSVGERAELPRGKSGLANFLAGFALTLSNPKVMVFYVALLPSLVDVRGMTPLGLGKLALTALLAIMTAHLAWAFTAAWARQWLRTSHARRLANRISATAMGGAAAAIATR
ncbi:LysE family translocator [Rhizobium laguerreae]|uniref:LysE family translocator n=1 Tax=Rhizobium laguerreae TaxID=1076926 RepID=UPI001C91701B|nr:LysE family translocator [Rhizobium laguerreae]MBY3217752.1 LysE family translocator [Rhizobium laguerreae]